MDTHINISRNKSLVYKNPYNDEFGLCGLYPLLQLCNFITAFLWKNVSISEKKYTQLNYRLHSYQEETEKQTEKSSL